MSGVASTVTDLEVLIANHRPKFDSRRRVLCWGDKCQWSASIVNSGKTGIQLHAAHVAAEIEKTLKVEYGVFEKDRGPVFQALEDAWDEIELDPRGGRREIYRRHCTEWQVVS